MDIEAYLLGAYQNDVIERDQRDNRVNLQIREAITFRGNR